LEEKARKIGEIGYFGKVQSHIGILNKKPGATQAAPG
jgi:hypothetical protein